MRTTNKGRILFLNVIASYITYRIDDEMFKVYGIDAFCGEAAEASLLGDRIRALRMRGDGSRLKLSLAASTAKRERDTIGDLQVATILRKDKKVAQEDMM